MICSQCGQDAKFQGYRSVAHLQSLFGDLVYSRSYYHCSHCHHGQFPDDQQLHLQQHQTPAFREVVATVGILEPFAQVAKHVLHRVSGLRQSASAVERITEAVGDQIVLLRAANSGQLPPQTQLVAKDINTQLCNKQHCNTHKCNQSSCTPSGCEPLDSSQTSAPADPPGPLSAPAAGPADSSSAQGSGLDMLAEAVQITLANTSPSPANPWPAPLAWTWSRDQQGRQVAYVSCDATSVPQQGPRGQKAPGRMPYVGAIFNAAPRHIKSRTQRRVRDVHYISGLMSLDELSRQLRREAQAVGLSQADRVIGLTDGGAGLEDCIQTAVVGLTSEVVFILDIHHVDDHLVEFSKVWCPDEAARPALIESWKTELRTHGGTQLLQTLLALDLTGRSAHVCEAHRTLTGYVRHNLHRMDYPTYLANGWQIGSGVIESGCKCVVGARLKRGGMRWREPGTNAMCHSRALYLSSDDMWNHYWSHIASG